MLTSMQSPVFHASETGIVQKKVPVFAFEYTTSSNQIPTEIDYVELSRVTSEILSAMYGWYFNNVKVVSFVDVKVNRYIQVDSRIVQFDISLTFKQEEGVIIPSTGQIEAVAQLGFAPGSDYHALYLKRLQTSSFGVFATTSELRCITDASDLAHLPSESGEDTPSNGNSSKFTGLVLALVVAVTLGAFVCCITAWFCGHPGDKGRQVVADDSTRYHFHHLHKSPLKLKPEVSSAATADYDTEHEQTPSVAESVREAFANVEVAEMSTATPTSGLTVADKDAGDDIQKSKRDKEVHFSPRLETKVALPLGDSSAEPERPTSDDNKIVNNEVNSFQKESILQDEDQVHNPISWAKKLRTIEKNISLEPKKPFTYALPSETKLKAKGHEVTHRVKLQGDANWMRSKGAEAEESISSGADLTCSPPVVPKSHPSNLADISRVSGVPKLPMSPGSSATPEWMTKKLRSTAAPVIPDEPKSAIEAAKVKLFGGSSKSVETKKPSPEQEENLVTSEPAWKVKLRSKPQDPKLEGDDGRYSEESDNSIVPMIGEGQDQKKSQPAWARMKLRSTVMKDTTGNCQGADQQPKHPVVVDGQNSGNLTIFSEEVVKKDTAARESPIAEAVTKKAENDHIALEVSRKAEQESEEAKIAIHRERAAAMEATRKAEQENEVAIKATQKAEQECAADIEATRKAEQERSAAVVETAEPERAAAAVETAEPKRTAAAVETAEPEREAAAVETAKVERAAAAVEAKKKSEEERYAAEKQIEKVKREVEEEHISTPLPSWMKMTQVVSQNTVEKNDETERDDESTKSETPAWMKQFAKADMH